MNNNVVSSVRSGKETKTAYFPNICLDISDQKVIYKNTHSVCFSNGMLLALKKQSHNGAYHLTSTTVSYRYKNEKETLESCQGGFWQISCKGWNSLGI